MADKRRSIPRKQVAAMTGRADITIRKLATRKGIGQQVGPTWVFTDDDVALIRPIDPRGGNAARPTDRSRTPPDLIRSKIVGRNARRRTMTHCSWADARCREFAQLDCHVRRTTLFVVEQAVALVDRLFRRDHAHLEHPPHALRLPRDHRIPYLTFAHQASDQRRAGLPPSASYPPFE